MKIVGLITEYNPFHNGHLYHIHESLRITGADAALVVMSGDYVQRGTPAIMPKRLRTEMALYCGAGAVLELPVCYATGSAEFFALGAISLLDSLGIVDSVCFGSECSDLPLLQKIAGLLVDEPEQYREILRHELKLGKSFPAARQTAVVFCTGDPRCADILKDPNNILGIEYLKALKKCGSSIRPYTIRRKGAGYHSSQLDGLYSSLLRSVPSWHIPARPFIQNLQEMIPQSFLFPIFSMNWEIRFQKSVWNFCLIFIRSSTRFIRMIFH